MKRIGQLFLAVVMVATLAGCSDGNESTSVTIRVSLSDNCRGIISQAVGDIESAEFDWKSGQVKLNPGFDRDVTLPRDGVYRYRFSSSLRVWEGYQSFSVGYDLPIYLSCL